MPGPNAFLLFFSALFVTATYSGQALAQPGVKMGECSRIRGSEALPLRMILLLKGRNLTVSGNALKVLASWEDHAGSDFVIYRGSALPDGRESIVALETDFAIGRTTTGSVDLRVETLPGATTAHTAGYSCAWTGGQG